MPKSKRKALSSKEIRLTRALDEAAKTLNTKGVSQTSLLEIAKRLGISRSALYYYFEDQEDLVFQCYRRTCEKLTIHLNQAKQRFTKTLDVVDAFIESVLAESEPEFAVLSESSFLRPDQRKIIFKLYDGLRNNLASILDAGKTKGEIRSCHSELAASTIIGLISWIERLLPEKDIPAQQLIETTKSLLRFGVAQDRSRLITYTPFQLSPSAVPAWQAFDQEVMAAAKQEAFLSAASWLFNLKGVDATSLEEIASRVGVSKKLIYHHVGDKHMLVSKCYRRAHEFYEDIGSRVLNYNGLRIDALNACAHALAEASLRSDICPFRPFTGIGGLTAAERKKHKAVDRHLTATYAEIYSQGVAEGSLRNITQGPPAVLALLPGAVEWLPKWIDSFSEVDRAIAPKELTELFGIGLSPV